MDQRYEITNIKLSLKAPYRAVSWIKRQCELANFPVTLYLNYGIVRLPDKSIVLTFFRSCGRGPRSKQSHQHWNISGLKDLLRVDEALDVLGLLLETDSELFLSKKIDNITARGQLRDFNFPLQLLQAKEPAETLGFKYRLPNECFPGLCLSRRDPGEPKGSLILFQGGKFLILGAKTVDSCQRLANYGKEMAMEIQSPTPSKLTETQSPPPATTVPSPSH